MKDNIMLLTDSYKASHWRQYPPGTTSVYSYLESRGGPFKELVFFGLQYYLREYLEGVRVTKGKIDEADKLFAQHIGPGVFNRAGWEHILNVHGGRLPIRIEAVAEGSIVPVKNVLMTVENTDPKCFWLTNYLETLLVQVWYATTVATQSRAIRRIILRFLEETGDPSLINFKLHDFGFRGVSSVESAAVGGAAHLLNFNGTDTVAGILVAQRHYGATIMPGFSIPAAEHSTITSWGRGREEDAMRNMLRQYPTGLVACVSDSYNIFNACSNIWGEKLKAEVLARDGVLVVRPDSGDPVEIVPQVLGLLADKFGYSFNSKNYKVLNPKVRVIQGDGVNMDSVEEILSAMEKEQFSADNITFGMGGALLQKVNRDTCSFAMKCSEVEIDGRSFPVYKDPETDKGKASKSGRFSLERDERGIITTMPGFKSINSISNLLVPVMVGGEITKEYTFEDCVARARA